MKDTKLIKEIMKINECNEETANTLIQKFDEKGYQFGIQNRGTYIPAIEDAGKDFLKSFISENRNSFPVGSPAAKGLIKQYVAACLEGALEDSRLIVGL